MSEKECKKKPKKTISEKQKAARTANLAVGRAKRLENIKNKKSPASSYEIESSESEASESESDDDIEFTLSKKKKETREKPKPKKESKPAKVDNKLQEDVNQLKTLTAQLIELPKKKAKKKPRKEPSNKLIVHPPQGGAPTVIKTNNADIV